QVCYAPVVTRQRRIHSRTTARSAWSESVGVEHMSLLLRRKAYRDLRAVIEDAAVNQPRSLQARIGPSQLGTPCDKCLAWALAELPRPREFAWFPVIGTGVHALLEEWVKPHDRYLTEERVTVGTVGGRDVSGSCDVYDTKTHTIIDYKITGHGTISKARKSGPSAQHRRSEEHTSELQSREKRVCRRLLDERTQHRGLPPAPLSCVRPCNIRARWPPPVNLLPCTRLFRSGASPWAQSEAATCPARATCTTRKPTRSLTTRSPGMVRSLKPARAAPPNSTGHKPTCTEKDSRTPAGLSRTSLFGSCPEPMPTLTTATTGPNPTTAAMLRPRSSGQTSWPQKLTTTPTTC